jgi:hypothetical protein
MKKSIALLLGCFALAGLEPASAQYVTGQWYVNEGSGTTIANTSSDTSNWGMTISGDPNLWGYWQPGAYTFANGGNAGTAITSAPAWTSGDSLALKADFNVTGNLHDSGSVFGGGAIFSGGYYLVTGGNNLGYNGGAFYAIVNTANPAAPTIEFDISGIGSWSRVLPTSVVDPNINGGWNTAEWDIVNNKQANSMTLQFRLNGEAVGGVVNISDAYLKDFTDQGGTNYNGTQFHIGAAAAGNYIAFTGVISNVSLATLSSPVFTTTPQSQNVLPGTNVTFTAVVSGLAPLSYQWYFNGTNIITNATSTTLTLTNVTSSQSGAYTLVATNSLGTASASASLAVYVPTILAVQLYNNLTIQGSVGFNYLIQYVDALTGPNNWQTLTNLALPSSPYVWFDLNSSSYASARAYRVVAAP